MKRYRNFATIVYPESAPENWQSILREMCIPSLISPLHDQDNDDEGNLKKAHYHVLLCFEGVKNYDHVHDLVEKFGGVGLILVESIRGYARYLCHLDDDDKYRYNIDDVISIGIDYSELILLPSDKYKALSDMINFINDNDIYEYCKLMDYCKDYNYTWFRLLADSNTYVIKEYIKSKRFAKLEGKC